MAVSAIVRSVPSPNLKRMICGTRRGESVMWASRIGAVWSGFDQPAWILLGAVLDLVLGDPFWRYHPLNLVSFGAERLCNPIRERGPLASVFWLSVVSLTVFGTITALLVTMDWLSVWLFRAGIVVFTFWGLPIRSVVLKSLAVYHNLVIGRTNESREELSRVAGRPTGTLSPRDLIKTTVESVADNLGQAIVAPLFFALIGGPAFLWLYKAIAALDGVAEKGHRRGEYPYRIAHAVHQVTRALPEALTSWAIMAVAATEGRFWSTWESVRSSPSPGSVWRFGHSQAAMAGALGIRLGGARMTNGVLALARPVGRTERNLDPSMILMAVSLMIRVTVLVSIVGGILLVMITGRWL